MCFEYAHSFFRPEKKRLFYFSLSLSLIALCQVVRNPLKKETRMMNNSFGGVSPKGISGDTAVGRNKYPPLMKNLTIQIPTDHASAFSNPNANAGDYLTPNSFRSVSKSDGLISFKTTQKTDMLANDRDLNNNLQKLGNLSLQGGMSGGHQRSHKPSSAAYSPVSSQPAFIKPPSIKSSVSHFKLSNNNDPYHYRNPAAFKVSQKTPTDEYEEESDSMCAVCDRKSTTIMCKNCGHDWLVSPALSTLSHLSGHPVISLKLTLLFSQFLKGRVRTKCPTHPSTVYLMDLEACIKCGSKDIKELD